MKTHIQDADRFTTKLTKCLSSWSTLAVALVTVTASIVTQAGELTIAWAPSLNDRVVGYKVYLGTEPGVYTKVVDAGRTSRTQLTELNDEQRYFMTVKGYDINGLEIGAPAAELASKPKPRIETIEPRTVEPGGVTYVTLTGENFDEALQVRARDARLIVRSLVPAGDGSAIVGIELASSHDASAVALDAASFTLINPGRKADEFFRAHPEVVDIDGDKAIGASDVAMVQTAFGSRFGDRGFDPAADLDGNGTVDGDDLTRVIARMGTAADASTQTR